MCLLMMIGLLLVIDVPAYSRGWVAFRDLPYMWMNGLVRAIGAVLLFVFCTYAIQLTQNRYMKWARNCIAVLCRDLYAGCSERRGRGVCSSPGA